MTVSADLPDLGLPTPEGAYTAFKRFVSEFDPIELLSQLTLTCLFTQKEFLGEASDERRWARLIEFTAGYLVSLPRPPKPLQTFDGSRIEEFESLVKRYFDSFMGIFCLSDQKPKNEHPLTISYDQPKFTLYGSVAMPTPLVSSTGTCLFARRTNRTGHAG